MSKHSIPSSGILHLPEAYEVAGTNRVVLSCRVSDNSQVANGSLTKQRNAAWRKINESGGQTKAIVKGVELGYIRGKRKHLQRSIHHARRHNAILVAYDVSRFIRPAAYHRIHNRWAMPTAEDFEYLRKRSKFVPCIATIIHPDTDLQTIHSIKTKMGQKHSKRKSGRPSKDPPYEVGQAILDDFETGNFTYPQLVEKYKQYNVSLSKMKRFVPRISAVRKG